MIIADNTGNRRKLLNAIAIGQLESSQLKPLNNTSDLKQCFDDENIIYLIHIETTELNVLKTILSLYNAT